MSGRVGGERERVGRPWHVFATYLAAVAGIFASGAWPWNAVAIGLAVLIVTLIAIGLAAVAALRTSWRLRVYSPSRPNEPRPR